MDEERRVIVAVKVTDVPACAFGGFNATDNTAQSVTGLALEPVLLVVVVAVALAVGKRMYVAVRTWPTVMGTASQPLPPGTCL